VERSRGVDIITITTTITITITISTRGNNHEAKHI
jgi:hypothetical protein